MKWFRITAKRKADIEKAKSFLDAKGYVYHYLTQVAEDKEENIRNLVKRFFPLTFLLRSDTPPVLPDYLKCRLTHTHQFAFYTEEEVENTLLFLTAYQGTYTLAEKIPSNCIPQALGTSGHPSALRGFLYKATGPLNRFYIDLLHTVCLFFPVAKPQEGARIATRFTKKENLEKRWYILQTHHEKETMTLLDKWKDRCTTYNPHFSVKNSLGQQLQIPVFRGIVFVHTSIQTLKQIGEDCGLSLLKSLCKVKDTEPSSTRYVHIEDALIRNFQSLNESPLVCHEPFEHKSGHTAILRKEGHPLNGQKGILRKKGKDYYLVFTLSPLCGTFYLPCLKVSPSDIEETA